MPHDQHGTSLPGDFARSGFRVPFLAISPWTKPHYVSHTQYDHTSLTRFIEARFGLPALTARDANATPPLDMFDFAHPRFMVPPAIDVHTTVDPAILSSCQQKLAPFGCGS
jgi:phospholipase C